MEMTRQTAFSPDQVMMAECILSQTEENVADFYQLHFRDHRKIHYDIKTNASLDVHEHTDRGLAQVCKYECSRHGEDRGPSFDFYRICLQDRKVLDLIQTPRLKIEMTPLLMYILTHELIHIIRFSLMGQAFFVTGAEWMREENRVHSITKKILKGMRQKDLPPVYEYFNGGGSDGATDKEGFLPITSFETGTVPGRIRTIGGASSLL
ncbi:hypothetical protein ACFL4G_06300 [Thermodesulfobacteriota bacterium]